MKDKPSSPQSLPKLIRWIARVLSIITIIIWGFFIINDLIAGQRPDSPPLSTNDYVQLVLVAIWLMGLVLAWKWELGGGAIILSAFTIHMFFNYYLIKSLGSLIPIAGVLFLLSWWLNKPSQSIKGARTS